MDQFPQLELPKNGNGLRPSGQTAVNVSATMLALSTVAIVLRGWARSKAKAKVAAEDWVILLAYLLFVAYTGVFIHGIRTSGGTLVSIEFLPLQFVNFFKYVYALELLFTCTITAVKVSILLFFRTIFPLESFRLRAMILLGLCIAWFVGCFLFTIFQCTPIEAFWNISLVISGEGKCVPFGNYLVGYEVSNVVFDIAIICLPIHMVQKMKLPTRRKVAVGTIFLLGGFVCIVCVIRIAYLYNASNAENTTALPYGLDWSIAELAVAILCACLPTYGPLFKKATIATSTIRSYVFGRGSHGTKQSTEPPTDQSGNSSSRNYNTVDRGSSHDDRSKDERALEHAEAEAVPGENQQGHG